jgi:hypothetical protein
VTNVLTITEAGQAVQSLYKDIPPFVLIPALQSMVQPVEYGIRERYRATSVAHHLAGQYLNRHASRLKLRAPLAKGVFVSVYTKGQYSSSPALRVLFYGLAALMEEGGRTKAHEIVPTSGFAESLGKKGKAFYGQRASALRLPNGFARRVNHPGSQFKRFGIAELVLNQAVPKINADIERRLTERIGFLKLSA